MTRPLCLLIKGTHTERKGNAATRLIFAEALLLVNRWVSLTFPSEVNSYSTIRGKIGSLGNSVWYNLMVQRDSTFRNAKKNGSNSYHIWRLRSYQLWPIYCHNLVSVTQGQEEHNSMVEQLLLSRMFASSHESMLCSGNTSFMTGLHSFRGHLSNIQ